MKNFATEPGSEQGNGIIFFPDKVKGDKSALCEAEKGKCELREGKVTSVHPVFQR